MNSENFIYLSPSLESSPEPGTVSPHPATQQAAPWLGPLEGKQAFATHSEHPAFSANNDNRSFVIKF